ncbi:type I restriction endonuclease, partial [Helicobacter bilis]
QMDNFYHKTTNNRKQIQNLQAMRDMLLKAIFA